MNQIIDIRGFREDLPDFPVKIEEIMELVQNPAFLSLYQMAMKRLCSIHIALRDPKMRDRYEWLCANMEGIEMLIRGINTVYMNGTNRHMEDSEERQFAKKYVQNHLEEQLSWMKSRT